MASPLWGSGFLPLLLLGSALLEGLHAAPLTNQELVDLVDQWFAGNAPVSAGPISTWDTSQVTIMTDLFYNRYTFNEDISAWNTSRVVAMDAMFRNCEIFNQDISGWDVSRVQDMSYMFSGAKAFDQSIGSWDTRKVTTMQKMFYAAMSFSGNIGSWETAQVTDMSYMFYDAQTFNADISGWDVSRVRDLDFTFFNNYVFNRDIGGWRTGNVESMSHTFLGCTIFDQDVGGWDTTKVKSMVAMFYGALNFNQNIGGWNTSRVTDMSSMFYQAQKFNQDIGGWVTNKVTNMAFMFYSAYVFNQDITGWDTGRVADMSYMFQQATLFNQNIGTWKTGSVTTMYAMFDRASSFDQDISAWDTSKVTNMGRMFSSALSFNPSMSTWNTGMVTDMKEMFMGASNFNGDIGSWDTSRVIDMSQMFQDASDFNQDLSAWNTSKVTSMSSMFAYATSFNGLVGSWDTSSVITMADMFYEAIAFNQDLNSWDTSKVTDMTRMFYRASSFNGMVGGWDTSQVTLMTEMFYEAVTFNQPIAGWMTTSVTDMSYMFALAAAFNQPIGGWDVASGVDFECMFLGSNFSYTVPWKVRCGTELTTTSEDEGQLFTGLCSSIDEARFTPADGGQCPWEAQPTSICAVYLLQPGYQSCSDWCGNRGRTALTGAWQCAASWEHVSDSEKRRLQGIGRVLSQGPYECHRGSKLDCDKPSQTGHMICHCEEAATSPVPSAEEQEEKALSDVLVAYGNNGETSITNTDDNVIVTATVMSSRDAVGGSVKVTVEGTVVEVDVPVSVIDDYGGQLVLVIAAYKSETVLDDQEILDADDDVIDVLSQPVSARLARMSLEQGEWVGTFFKVENLEDPIAIKVPTRSNLTGVSWDCGFFNETTDRWMLTNIELAERAAGYLVCTTTHLTIFGAIGSTFVEALRCSNAFLLSADGIKQIGKGTWATEVPAIILWCICVLHLGLAVAAARFDFRAREEHLWTDRDFLRERDPLQGEAAAKTEDSPASKAPPKSLGEILREKHGDFNKGQLRLRLRAQVDAFCIRHMVAHRIWLAPGDMQSVLEALAMEEELPLQLARAAGEEPPAEAPSWMSYPTDQPPPKDHEPPTSRDMLATPAPEISTTSGASPKSMEPLADPKAQQELPRSQTDITVFKSLVIPKLRSRTTPMSGGVPVTHRKSWNEPVMKSLAKPVRDEIEAELEEYYALQSSRRYAAAVLCFALQPWLQLYRYSIYDSCMVRTLFLTAEVFGALTFSAFFFGIDAPAVDSPEACDSDGGWAEELWSEIAAGLLGFWFGLIPVLVMRLLSRRSFMELADAAAIQQQLLRWRLQDIAIWIIGLSYIAFCLLFTITFLSNTKMDSGLSFVASTAVEELLLNLFVPIMIALAYIMVDLSTRRKEEDYIKVKELMGLANKQGLSAPSGQVVGKPAQDVLEI